MKVPKALVGKLVLVVWDDASTDTETHQEPHEYVATITYSVGILGKKTRAGIVLFTDYIPALKEFGIKSSIPKGMIKDIIILY